jgi:deoxyribodipyrimidine photo-lyase
VTTIVWFRSDLRLADNPALAEAAARGPVIPVYVWAPGEEGDWAPGAASRWWLHRSLTALDAELRRRRSRLIIRRGGSTRRALSALMHETGAQRIVWNRRYEPAVLARDLRLLDSLPGAQAFAGSLLWEPWQVQTRSGGPYQVFTPFWRAVTRLGEPRAPIAVPRISSPEAWPGAEAIDSLGLAPGVRWDTGLEQAWVPGEAGARDALDEFAQRAARYADDRDRLDRVTSRLSPHLHFGEVSPAQVWAAVTGSGAGGAEFRRQLVWREFAHHLLHHFPDTDREPLRPASARMPWRDDPEALRRWQRGETGYELVDAGMRQLWQTGWMHNRVRMVAASFLTKHLLIHWREGARWFWDTLVDADLANNSLGWQWVAGSGADAAPFHRIFNPVAQARRFDPDGAYRDRWLGDGPRPAPIVELTAARERALGAYRAARELLD